MSKDDTVYLKHVLESISKIEHYTKSIKGKEFKKKTLVQDAVMRQIEIIGEAVKRLSHGIKDKYSSIPWKDISGMRDKLIHAYFGVDLDAVWKTVKKDIPHLKAGVKKIIEESLK